MSATLTPEVQSLKKLVLHNPAVLKLEETEDEARRLAQYYLQCTTKDKFLVLYGVLRLKHIVGKVLIFVSSLEMCYKVKLFLEQFSIKSAVLNAELPQNSRLHIMDQFNRGVCDIIIATDAAMEALNDDDDEGPMDVEPTQDDDISGDEKDEEASTDEQSDEGNEDPNSEEEEEVSTKNSKRAQSDSKPRKRQRIDKEYGVTRGVDFKDVKAVINMDFPSQYAQYVHRVGRTARGDKSGVAFSLIDTLVEEDQRLLDNMIRKQADVGRQVAEYRVQVDSFSAFRYRVEDVLSNVTRMAIDEARQSELRREILNSEKLKAHFEDNPKDKDALRHDRPINARRVQSHLATLPAYLLPQDGKGRSMGKGGKSRKGGKGGKGSKAGRGKKTNPLKSFKMK